MAASSQRLLRTTWTVSLVTILLVSGAANAESLSAVFKMYRDACLPEHVASSRFMGLPNVLTCITKCIMAQKDFEAVQVLPSMEPPAGRLDCECVLLSAASLSNRNNCQRWDVQTKREGSGNESSLSPSGYDAYDAMWNATFCPAIENAWNPVVDINKCIFMKNTPRLTAANLSSNPCTEGHELFNVKDSTTEAQLQKYLSYLVGKGAEQPPFWVRDTRSASVPACTVVFANGTVAQPEGCDADPATSVVHQFYPICQKTLAFAGVNTSELVVLNTGSNSLTWYHYSNEVASKNASCNGSLPVLIDTDDVFTQVKNGIIIKGWSNQNVWIARGAYVTARTTVTSECIALRINNAADTISTSVVAEDCASPNNYICEARINTGGTSAASGQTAWLVSNFCPIPVLPMSMAREVRAVGSRCFFYTNASYAMNPSPTGDVCSETDSGNPYHPAQINSDFLMSRYYIRSVAVSPSGEAWMWNSGWNGDFINGYAITVQVSGSGAFYLNNSGSPFKADASFSRPVICKSNQQICDAGQNYWNFASATNSCVSVEMASNTWNQSVANCQAKAGSLLRLDNDEKFNQIRDLLHIRGHLNQLFWAVNPVEEGQCTALQITDPTASFSTSVVTRPCTDTQNYLCERPYVTIMM